MDRHALEVLEFPVVVRRVEAATDAELGAELAGAPPPGRGTGAVSPAMREELTSHQLVERHETDPRDGATRVRLG